MTLRGWYTGPEHIAVERQYSDECVFVSDGDRFTGCVFTRCVIDGRDIKDVRFSSCVFKNCQILVSISTSNCSTEECE